MMKLPTHNPQEIVEDIIVLLVGLTVEQASDILDITKAYIQRDAIVFSSKAKTKEVILNDWLFRTRKSNNQ